MRNAVAYLNHIKALIALNRQVIRWKVLREEAQGNVGLYRYRLTLRDGSLLEMFERFSVSDEQVHAGKYSFHWQDSSGLLRKRWDNAAHQPNISTHPHHVHDGIESNVLPHEAITAEGVLALISGETED